jgi:hypothetical protein
MSEAQTRYSYAAAAKEAIDIQFPVATTLAWDSFWRLAYQKANLVIQEQANALVARGNITMEEARDLVEVQRNGLVVQMREPLSPFGKFYSETLKPAANLPTLEGQLAQKGSLEAVLTSVGKSRAVVDRLGFYCRRAGVAGFALEIVAIAVAVEKAPPGHKGEVATEEITGAVLDTGFETMGMWSGAAAGAAWAGTWASPTLLIPGFGELTEGGAILIGGIAGGFYFGWLAHDADRQIAHVATQNLWRLLPIEWTQ